MEFGGVSYWPLPDTSITLHPELYGTTIVDYEFVTSAGDYSQVCTDELSTWDISSMVQEFDTELSNYKKEMLIKGQIPHERIMEWFANKTVGRSYGRWWYAIKELPQMYAYYSMLSSGEAWRGCELSPEEYLESHPMRVFSIAHSVSISGDDNISINNLALGDFDRVLYALCVGKLSVKEITEKLQGDYGGVDKDIFSLVKKCLAKYEAAYLRVFSKY